MEHCISVPVYQAKKCLPLKILEHCTSVPLYQAKKRLASENFGLCTSVPLYLCPSSKNVKDFFKMLTATLVQSSVPLYLCASVPGQKS